MKSSTRLDSVVFQLTPTRTRCDLVIVANGKTEKIISGLLEPFLAHLKTAQDQMTKGGYSITLEPLEPEHTGDATWFTKATVERFIRFVNTPEVLERVYSLESEILQIEEAITIQGRNDIGLSAVDHQEKSMESFEGCRIMDSNEEKAIVLYKPGAPLTEGNGSAKREANSKFQLLKVLETRKTLLQKEQGMAFARAAAAGFDMDHMAPLLSFAESFGALRLMNACLKFIELWKGKHETGQWLEMEAAEGATQSNFSSTKASGIKDAGHETSENNGTASTNSNTEEKPYVDRQLPPGQQEYFQGQFPHNMYPPWPIHPSAGTLPVFQGYPMQGMPYFQNHQGNSPFFRPPYPATEDPRHNSGQRMGRSWQSVDSGDGNTDLETWEMNGSKGKSQDDEDREKGASRNREPVKKASPSGRKQSRMVVIRNINYITSKGGYSSDTESESASGSLTEEEGGDVQANTPNMKHTHSIRSSKKEGSHAKPVDVLNPSDKEGKADAKETDSGQWGAFQNYLLRDADEGERESNQNLFAIEKEVRVRRKKKVVDDPLAFYGKDIGEYEDAKVIDMHKTSGNLSRIRRSNDESFISRNLGHSGDGRGVGNDNMDLHSTEIDGKRGVCRSTTDDFIIRRQYQSGDTASLSDPLNGFEPATYDLDKKSPQNMDDDSYVVSLRSNSLDQVGSSDRNAIVMYSELPSSHPRAESLSSMTGNRVYYEPYELSLIPGRGMEKGSSGYDPALDYEMQIQSKDGASLHKKNKEAVIDAKRGSKNNDQKSKIPADTSDKKTVGSIRRGKSAKPSPLDEARARAERLRNFKADLQKIKKEKEEEQKKRLEALKIERHKRIAARSGFTPTQSTSQQTKKQLPIKHSPSSQKGSKYSDSEPGPVSPLQRFPVRTISARSNNSHKASKSSKLTAGSESGGNRLSRSVSSLPEPKKENSAVTPDMKVSLARLIRLSEPKMNGNLQVLSMKPRSSGPSSKQKVSDGQESKNVSAIVNHDRNKTASLTELKIKITKDLSVAQGKSGTKEMQNKANDTKASTAPEVLDAKRNSDKVSHHSDGEDNPIVEKTVVMLEYEKSSNPVVYASEGNICLQRGPVNNYKKVDKTEQLADYAAIRAPVSPLPVDGDGREPVVQKVPGPSSAHEVTTGHLGHADKMPSRISSSSGVEKPYQAPYAQVFSLGEQCTGSSEYGREPPTNIQVATVGMETVKVHVSDSTNSKLEKITEVPDKPQIKESSKGFRRLLKFGRKTHSSTAGEHNSEPDDVSVNGSNAVDIVTNASSSIEVHTLKNLISQDETPTANSTPQKNGRHFSLLSPFRSKTSEKKLTI